MTTRAVSWPVVAALLLVVLVLAGCGSQIAEAPLPTLIPTDTPLPHTTPTFVPLPTVAPPADTAWDDLDLYRAAMREGFEEDVDAFADRNRYRIEATVTLGDVATISGAQRVRYTNRSADTLNEIVFRLYPNLEAFSAYMDVSNVMVGDVPVEVSFSQRRSVLHVPLPEPLESGERAEISMQFSSAIEKGFTASYGEYSFQQGVYTAPEWYPVLSIYNEGEGWWMVRTDYQQGEQTYTETGLYDIRLTAAEDLQIIMSGSEIDTLVNEDGTVTHHVVSGPMRDSILIASRTLLSMTDKIDGITVNIYYWDDPDRLEQNADAAAAGLEFAKDSLHVFNRAFGEYPFAEFDIVQTNTGAGGIEYPGVIVIANTYWNAAAPFFEIVIAHEAGHQWFYSLVGNNQVAEPFVDESLTSYTEYVYLRETAETDRERQQAEDFIRQERQQYNNYVGTDNPDLPLGLPAEQYFEFQYGMIIYTKGPLFLEEITRTIGQEQMYAFFQEYFRRYKYEIAYIGDVLDTLEDVTGQEWDQMFYEWVGPFDGLDPSAIATVDALNRGS